MKNHTSIVGRFRTPDFVYPNLPPLPDYPDPAQPDPVLSSQSTFGSPTLHSTHGSGSVESVHV